VGVGVTVLVAVTAIGASGSLIHGGIASDCGIETAIAVYDVWTTVRVIVFQGISALGIGTGLVLSGTLTGRGSGTTDRLSIILHGAVDHAGLVGTLTPLGTAHLSVGTADTVLTVQTIFAVALFQAGISKNKVRHAGAAGVGNRSRAVATRIAWCVIITAGIRASSQGVVLVLCVGADGIGTTIRTWGRCQSDAARVISDLCGEAL